MDLPKKEKNKKLQEFKRKGILQYNKTEAQKKDPEFQREKRGIEKAGDKLIHCGYCNSCVSSRQYWRHKLNCQKNSCQKTLSVAPINFAIPSDVDTKFREDILDKFREDEIGRICKTDKTLLEIGQVQK